MEYVPIIHGICDRVTFYCNSERQPGDLIKDEINE